MVRWAWTIVGIIAFSFNLTADTPPPAAIRTPSSIERSAYLAHASIWKDPGPLSPEEIELGPDPPPGDAVARSPLGRPVECRYEKPGVTMGGKTPKFGCRTSAGQFLRLKYFGGGDRRNREVFSEVAATRLLWALGFDADSVFPLVVDCFECPEDPFTGKGARDHRRFLASYEPHYTGVVITSNGDLDQGWTFGELETAIDSLPPGPFQRQQRERFDALSLLAVFIQHGDRKRGQQRLVCRGDLDLSHGTLQEAASGEESGTTGLQLFERPGSQACAGGTVVTLQDVGATFGGAGRLTKPDTAKVHLKSWAAEPVFTAETLSGDAVAECHGRITVSGAAGDGARANPRIGEAGRLFLLTQLARLSPAHIHAIFEVSRVNELNEPFEWHDHASGQTYTGLDAWVAVFLDKVAQIERQHCRQ